MTFRFLAYSDIHHDNYTNGITLGDTIAIEDGITDYAISQGMNTVLFGGDWYRATNPTQEVIKAAEASWVRRSNADITTITTPGNHDRWTKSITSGHAFGGVNIFNNDLKNVKVFDEIGVYSTPEVDILFLPAGWENTPINHVKERPLIIVFHGLISGSLLASGIKANGVDPNIIKSANPDLVLGGDNHTPQSLEKLFGCPAFYLGAPLQHTWGDAGQARGFWIISYENGRFNCEMIPTPSPRFVKKQVPANTEIEALCNSIDILNKELENCSIPGIIELTLVGRNVTNIDLNNLGEHISRALAFNKRQLRIIADKTFDRLEVVQGISEAKTPEDKWNMYVADGKATGIKEMNPKLLSEIGTWAIQEARKPT